jgi:hypothetical protein
MLLVVLLTKGAHTRCITCRGVVCLLHTQQLVVRLSCPFHAAVLGLTSGRACGGYA